MRIWHITRKRKVVYLKDVAGISGKMEVGDVVDLAKTKYINTDITRTVRLWHPSSEPSFLLENGKIGGV